MSTLEIEVLGPTGAAPTTSVDIVNGTTTAATAAKPTPAPAAAEAPPAAEKPPAPAMADAVKDRIAAIRNGPPKTTTATPSKEPAPTAEAAVEDIPTAADDPEPADAPDGEPAKAADPWETERAELQSVTQRQRGVIEKLEADLAEARKASASDIAARSKRIEEAEEMYVRSPTKAVRTFVAAALGIDPDSDEFKNEMLDVFVDLTSEISGATPDPAHQAKRVSALTRREWDLKDKRRAAGDKTQVGQATPSEPSDPNQTAVTIIKDSFKPIASKYPHLTSLAAELDGRTVESVLWEVIDKGIKRGDFDAKADDATLVAKAAELADTHYKRRHEKIVGAIPSTATPGVPPAEKQEDKPAAAPSKTSQRQGNGRSLSNADASVAPAQTPPVQKDERPAFKSDEDRRRWATRHLRGER